MNDSHQKGLSVQATFLVDHLAGVISQFAMVTVNRMSWLSSLFLACGLPLWPLPGSSNVVVWRMALEKKQGQWYMYGPFCSVVNVVVWDGSSYTLLFKMDAVRWITGRGTGTCFGRISWKSPFADLS